jgi:hypothetical protein
MAAAVPFVDPATAKLVVNRHFSNRQLRSRLDFKLLWKMR